MAVIDLTPFNTILQRLEGVAVRLETAAGAAPTGGAAAPVASGGGAEAPLALAFDAFLAVHGEKVQKAAAGVGKDEVTAATADWFALLKLLRGIFAATDKCAKPKDEDWAAILKPLLEVSGKVNKAPDNRSEYFSHQKAVAETMQVVSLPAVPSPVGHAQAALEAMDFHANKVLMKKVAEDTAWMRALKEAMKELVEWCKENVKMGITWKVGGQNAKEYFDANPLGAPAAAAAPGKGATKGKGKGAAPPPPKGGLSAPPAGLFKGMSKPAAGGGGGMSDVFAQLAKLKEAGGSEAAGLKTVSDDMKTKNRAKDDVAAAAPKAKAAAPKAAAAKGKGPRGEPKMEVERGNWVVENQEGGMLALEEVEQSQLVCILNCRNVTIKLTSKVKSICIDGCLKVSLLCGDVISAVELVNSDRCIVQTTGKVNSFAIDKCDGVMVHLSKVSLEAEFTTAKSSEMNVTMPDPKGEDGDLIEMPIPEQFVSKVNLTTNKLHTRVSDLYS